MSGIDGAAAIPGAPPAMGPSTDLAAQRRANNRLLLILGSIAISSLLFFLFGFRSIYGLWCSFTGTKLNPNNQALAALPAAATGRMLKVHYESKVFAGLPVAFTVDHPEQEVEVGVYARNTYRMRNLTDRELHVRPVHQLSPINATPCFFLRICFCFQDQVLAPHEEKVFPVEYRFTAELDQRINDVSMCYSVFDISDERGRSAAQRAEDAVLRARQQAEDAR